MLWGPRWVTQGSSGGASRPPTVISSAPVIEDILRRGASCTIHHDRKHAVGTTDGVVATVIPEMGCRRDYAVMAGGARLSAAELGDGRFSRFHV